MKTSAVKTAERMTNTIQIIAYNKSGAFCLAHTKTSASIDYQTVGVGVYSSSLIFFGCESLRAVRH